MHHIDDAAISSSSILLDPPRQRTTTTALRRQQSIVLLWIWMDIIVKPTPTTSTSWKADGKCVSYNSHEWDVRCLDGDARRGMVDGDAARRNS